MLFDLEIQPNLVDIVYIKQGNDLHSSLIPVSYCNVTERNIIPADIIEIEEDSRFTSFSTAKIEIISDQVTQFPVVSEKFLMTHVKKYSNKTGSDIPLFYKHVINMVWDPTKAKWNTIPEDSIRIYDTNGVSISKDDYSIEYFSGFVCVYMNPVDDNILRVEYSVSDGIKNELIKLELIFSQVEWDWVINKSDLGPFEYLFFNNTVFTKFTGAKYFVYQRDVSVFKKPIAGMNESWYLRLENLNFTDRNETYSMPEFNLQQMNYGLTVKKYSNIAAKIVGNKYVKLQDVIIRDYLSSVNIYIKNVQQDAMEYLFTANRDLHNTIDQKTGLRWLPITDWNTDGIFELPVTLTEDHLATSDFKTPNKYYELRTLDLNSMDINSSKILGIYIMPVGPLDDMTISVFFAYVGVFDEANSYDKIKVSGSGFKNKQEYRDTLDQYYGVHLAYVSLSTAKMLDITEFYDARDFNGGILDKVELSKTDYDIFINDVASGEILLPTGDTLVATINPDIYAKQRNSKDNLDAINEKNLNYQNFVKDTLNKNLDISTDVIIQNSIGA